jgi:hypothetical protein
MRPAEEFRGEVADQIATFLRIGWMTSTNSPAFAAQRFFMAA